MWSISDCLAIIHFEINKAMGADINLDRVRGICIMTSSITARDKLPNGCSLQLCNTYNVQCYFYNDFEYFEFRAIPDPYTNCTSFTQFNSY